MTGFSPEDGARLLELQNEKKELITRFHGLTCDQEKLLHEEDVELMNLNLTHRQRIIEKVNTLHQELNPLVQSYHEHSASPQAIRISAAFEEAEEQITRLLNECRAMDEKNAVTAKKLMVEFGDKAKKSRDSQKTISVYKPGGFDTSEYFDKKQ